MKDKESLNLSKSKGVKKPYTELPPQESAYDTSNRENRNVGAVIFDTGAKKRTVRMVDFLKAKELEPFGLTREQVEKILKEQGLSDVQIKQRLSGSDDTTKSSKLL